MADPADVPAEWVDAVYPVTLAHGIPWHDEAIRIMLAALDTPEASRDA